MLSNLRRISFNHVFVHNSVYLFHIVAKQTKMECNLMWKNRFLGVHARQHEVVGHRQFLHEPRVPQGKHLAG